MDLSQRSELTQSVERSSGSYELVLASALIALVGFGIDSWLGTLPLFTLIFAFIGFIGSSASLYFRYQAEMAKASQLRVQEQSKGTPGS